MRRWPVTLPVIPLIFGYLFMVGFLTLNQDRLLYLPDPTPPSSANLRSRTGSSLVPWPPDSGPAFRGYVRAEAGGAFHGTAVVFHGNAGSARDRAFYLDALERHGVRVVLAEYPGYGGRAGNPSETTLVADGRETARLARMAFGEPLWLEHPLRHLAKPQPIIDGQHPA